MVCGKSFETYSVTNSFYQKHLLNHERFWLIWFSLLDGRYEDFSSLPNLQECRARRQNTIAPEYARHQLITIDDVEPYENFDFTPAFEGQKLYRTLEPTFFIHVQYDDLDEQPTISMRYGYIYVTLNPYFMINHLADCHGILIRKYS